MFIKVCGLKNFDHIDWAVDLGYTAMGIVLHRQSPRYCSTETALKMSDYARGKIATVAVALRYKDVKEIAADFDFIQIYEEVAHKNLIFAGDSPPAKISYRYFLYDRSMGSGDETGFPDWLSDIRESLIIAGGLNPSNVSGIINTYHPFGVDVSSGVEIDRGIKDYHLMKRFIEEVKNASQ